MGKRLGPAVLLGMGALLLAGCGGGDPGTTIGGAVVTTTPAPTTPGPTTPTPAATTTTAATATATATTAAAPTTPAPSTTRPVGTTGAAALPPCRTDQFQAAFGPLQADAGTGTRLGVIILTNVSTRACSLYGSGKVTMLDKDWGAMLVEGLQPTQRRAPTMLRVAPGTKVYRDMIFDIPDRGTEQRCAAPASAMIEIPEGAGAVSARWTDGPLCGLGGQPYRQGAG